MKYTILVSTLLASLNLAVFADNALPLKVDAGANWKVEYKGDDGIQFFTLTRSDGENVVFMFSRWPVPGGRKQIPANIKELAVGFLAEAAKNAKLKIVTKEYKIEKIQGVEYSGEVAVFSMDHGLKQTIFMVSEGDGIWSGQFTGSSAMWGEAKSILQKLKKGEQ